MYVFPYWTWTWLFGRGLGLGLGLAHSAATNTDRQVFKYFPNTPPSSVFK